MVKILGNKRTHNWFFFLICTIVHFQPGVTLWVRSKLPPVGPVVLGLGKELLLKLINCGILQIIGAKYLILTLHTNSTPSIVDHVLSTTIRFCKHICSRKESIVLTKPVKCDCPNYMWVTGLTQRIFLFISQYCNNHHSKQDHKLNFENGPLPHSRKALFW